MCIRDRFNVAFNVDLIDVPMVVIVITAEIPLMIPSIVLSLIHISVTGMSRLGKVLRVASN